jgi:hypothetical protein
MENGLDKTILPSELPVYPITVASSEWRTYILHESARRTMLILFFMLALCHALRGSMGFCQKDGAVSNYHLGSAHLWNATSAFDFAKAWNEKNRLIVADTDYGPLLITAQPDDFDTFGKMLLVAKLGIDETRGWFDYKGGIF